MKSCDGGNGHMIGYVDGWKIEVCVVVGKNVVVEGEESRMGGTSCWCEDDVLPTVGLFVGINWHCLKS